MFSGQYRYTLDPKGRLTIPGKFREELANGGSEVLMLTADVDPYAYLVAYPMEEWDRLMENLRSHPTNTNRALKDWMRYHIGRAMECPLDRHGRILVPPALRQFSRLNRQVILLGMNEKFEIWDERRWGEKEEHIRQSSDQIMDEVSKQGL